MTPGPIIKEPVILASLDSIWCDYEFGHYFDEHIIENNLTFTGEKCEMGPLTFY